MADNAKIKLILKQTADGSTDSSELFTRGEFREHGGSFFIDYDESEATGYAGSHVQLRIGQQDDTVTMTRTGKAFSSLVFENGKRHFCQYDMNYRKHISELCSSRTRELRCHPIQPAY